MSGKDDHTKSLKKNQLKSEIRGEGRGQFTDARKQAENRLALLARGPAKKKPSSKGAGEKRPTKVTISEDEAPKKKKAKPSVPEGSNGSNGAHVAAPASSSAAPAAPAPASSSALVKPSAGGDAPAAVKTKGVLKKKTSLGGGGEGEAAPFHKLAASVAAGADSGKVARELFALLIAPITIDEFYRDYHEKKPLLVKRGNPKYYDNWLKMAGVKKLVAAGLEWNSELDATSYKDGARTTLNGTGVAEEESVWDKYNTGCSVRLLRPQRRMDGMAKLLSLLEGHWGSGAGANVYLTPADHQGFAPHWDDIEAFILQTEGAKHWQVYAPRNKDEEMPRYSSGNLEQGETGKPVLEADVEAGDLLYFPRGYIHQARSAKGTHSLHVTVSYGYRNAWYDYLKIALNQALETAVREDVTLRRGLPHDFFDVMGAPFVGEGGKKEARRKEITATANRLMATVSGRLDLDEAADERARQFLRERL
ncbi:hypothetical protein T484DRAFT_1899432, partial [Baffinella frigidus]